MLSVPIFHKVHVLGTPLINCPAGITANDVAYTGIHEDLARGHARSPDTVKDDLELSRVLFNDLQGVKQRRERHNGRAMLIVMKHRDIDLVLQPLLDLEAAWCRNVFQVNPTEDRRNALDRIHNDARVFIANADWEGVNASKFFEQGAFPFHDGHGRCRDNVTESPHGSAVRDYGHRIFLDRQIEHVLWLIVNGHTDACHPWGVGHRQIIAIADGSTAVDFDFSTQMHQEGTIRLVQ